MPDGILNAESNLVKQSLLRSKYSLILGISMVKSLLPWAIRYTRSGNLKTRTFLRIDMLHGAIPSECRVSPVNTPKSPGPFLVTPLLLSLISSSLTSLPRSTQDTFSENCRYRSGPLSWGTSKEIKSAI